MGFSSPTLFGTNRQVGGAKAKSAGKQFEQLILASQSDAHGEVCALIRIESFAQWVKSSPDWERRTGEKLRLVKKKSPFDFTGSVCGSGIGVHFDAKSFDEKCASFPANNENVVKPQQIDALVKLERANAFAGFLVRCGRMGDFRWLWATHCDGGRTRIQWSDPRWVVLGHADWGKRVELRRLFEAYH